MTKEEKATKLRSMEKKFFKRESSNRDVYLLLSLFEKKEKLRSMLKALSEKEDRHADLWGNILKETENAKPSLLLRTKVIFLAMIGKVLGIAFLIKLLERSEAETLNEYSSFVEDFHFGKAERIELSRMIKEEEAHEAKLAKEIQLYEGDLDYTRSIILGLNDGLVEVFAVVAGLAVIASTSIIVVAGGIIVGVSGTLSMAGGTYLSSKSHGLVEKALESKAKATLPRKDAFYTGIYYFLGAAVPVIPFVFGAKGYDGIFASLVLVCLALSTASVIVAVISGTSIRKRIFEMVLISVSAAIATIFLGSVMKAYFGIVI
jgi:VIT1/CCC1 family predicted Fe2+/Mn2+ transporter